MSGWAPGINAPSEATAIACVLRAGGPEDHLADIVPLLPNYTGLAGQLCTLKEISPDIVRLLLAHPDDRLASEVAIQLWHGLDGRFDKTPMPAWRTALLRADDRSSWTGGILSTDAGLAFEWFERQIRAGNWRTLMQEHITKEAANPLGEGQRAQLLLMMTRGRPDTAMWVEQIWGRPVHLETRQGEKTLILTCERENVSK